MSETAPRWRRWAKRAGCFAFVLLIGPLLTVSCGSVNLGRDWRTADRASTGLAPPAAQTPEAIVQIYSARAFNWRGIFAVHTWIATKAADDLQYTVHQVLGWRRYHDVPVVVSRFGRPDRSWYGAEPEVVAELRGERAALAIPKIEAAVESYPYRREYVLWPGPNSNTFTAYVARQVPELEAELPAIAIGKDYLANGSLVDRPPSGSGFQLSLFGLAGVLASWNEGLELNLLGLVFGLDPLGPAFKLPGLGRVGLDLDRD